MENLKKVKETILELIYPSKCPFCGEIVSAGKKHSTEHNGICKACREKLPYIGEVKQSGGKREKGAYGLHASVDCCSPGCDRTGDLIQYQCI